MRPKRPYHPAASRRRRLGPDRLRAIRPRLPELSVRSQGSRRLHVAQGVVLSGHDQCRRQVGQVGGPQGRRVRVTGLQLVGDIIAPEADHGAARQRRAFDIGEVGRRRWRMMVRHRHGPPEATARDLRRRRRQLLSFLFAARPDPRWRRSLGPLGPVDARRLPWRSVPVRAGRRSSTSRPAPMISTVPTPSADSSTVSARRSCADDRTPTRDEAGRRVARRGGGRARPGRRFSRVRRGASSARRPARPSGRSSGA